MLGDAIHETVEILRQLKNNDSLRIYALTNWSAETFPVAQRRFGFLQWFEGIIVSGTEKTRKPFRDIYETTLNRFNISAGQSIFIDDNLRNIEAANDLGINGIHFKSPAKLIDQLKEYRIHIN